LIRRRSVSLTQKHLKSTSGTRRWLDLVPTSSTQLDPQTLTETRPRLVVEHMATSTMDTVSAPDLPQRYVPNVDVTVPVTLTNTTDTAWPAGLQLSYRWAEEGQTADVLTATSGRYTNLFTDTTRALQPGESVTVNMTLKNPINSDTGANLSYYDLYLDMWNPQADPAQWWSLPTAAGGQGHTYYLDTDLSQPQLDERDAGLADQVCTLVPTGLECRHRVVQSASSTGMGLEKFATYAGEETGAGAQALVNLNNGNLIWSYDAISNPSVGPSFFARVSYNSQDTRSNTGMGYGWSVQPGTLTRLNTPLVLNSSPDKAVTLTDGDGTDHVWRNPVTTGTVTTYDRPAGIHLDLVKDTSKPDGERYAFVRPDGTIFYVYGTTLLPSKVVDLNGNTLTYGYDGSNRLSTVTDTKQRVVARLGYNAGKIAWIADVSNRALVFDYDPAAPEQVKSLRDGGPFNTTTGVFETGAQVKTFGFTYSNTQANLHTVLWTVTDPKGNVSRFGYYDNPDAGNDLTNNTYPNNTSQTLPSWVTGKVRATKDRMGQVTQYEYFDSNQLPSGTSMPAGASRFTRVIDVNGSASEMTTYGIDPYGRSLKVQDANANAADATAQTKLDATLLGWDADHNVVRLQEPNGAVSRWVYSPKTGYPRRTWTPEAVRTGGGPTVLTYQTASLTGATELASITSPLGHPTTFVIDTRGRLIKVTDPTNGVTQYTYNTDGTLATATDPNQRSTGYTYPAAAAENIGYPSLITPPTATVAPGDLEADKSTNFAYDVRGNVLTTSRTDGTVTLSTTAAYDAFGRTTTVTTPGAQGADPTVSYTYDCNDNLVTQSTPNPISTTQVDACNDPVLTGTSAGQATTSNAYRADDQPATTTLPSNGSGTRMVAFGYDPLGRLCREVQPNAEPTGEASCPAGANDVPPAYAVDYRYDHAGQLVSTTQPDPAQSGSSLVTSYGYDSVGNVVWMRDPKTNRTDTGGTIHTNLFAYDLNHQQITATDAAGYSTRAVYDADGQVSKRIDQAGKPTTYTYDAAGRLKTTTVVYNPPGADPRELTTTRDYDPAGNLIKVTRPRTISHSTTTTKLFTRTYYDENNRPYATDSAYDAAGTDPRYQTPVTTYLRYDALGRMSDQSIPTQGAMPAVGAAGKWSSFTHFDSGDIATSTDPTRILTSYEYNQLGQQTKRILTGADANGPTTNTRTMTWAYHPDGSLSARTDASTSATRAVKDNPPTTSTTPSTWSTVTPTSEAGQTSGSYLAHGAAASTDTVTWQLSVPQSGTYRVQYNCPAPTNGTNGQPVEPSGARASVVTYTQTVGTTTTPVTGDHSNCSTPVWRNLGQTVSLKAGDQVTLKLTPSATGVVVADAVRLVCTDCTTSLSYTYDRNGQQTSLTDNDPNSRTASVTTTYDALGRALTVKELGAASAVLRKTDYAYDANSNPLSVISNRYAQSGATDEFGNVDVTSSTTYAWDARNLVSSVTGGTNAGTTADSAALRTWSYTWTSRGQMASATKPSPAGTTGQGNKVTYGYFDTGWLKDQTETIQASGANNGLIVARHQMTYNDDGDPARDIAKLLIPDTGKDAIPVAWRDQTSRYSYTPTQQLAGVDKTGTKAGGDESYVYDIYGNVTWSSIGTPGQSVTKAVTKSEYLNNRLVSTTPVVNGVDQTASKSTYHYDDFGRLDTVTASSKTVASYTYDGFDRIIAQTQGTGGSAVTTSSTYDPFDRVAVRTVETGTGTAAKTAKTRFNYLGVTGQVAAEEQTDATHPWQVSKAYTYGPAGNPLALVSTPLTGTGKTRFYSVNPHGDTEALTDPTTGLTTATYRYSSYGSPDDNGTLGEDAKPTSGPVDPTADVVNPYRYASKRIDVASGGYDMGFRTYNPSLNTFLSRDMYNGALADQSLGIDPWNTNRYAFAGGNPISHTDLDGHYCIEEDGTRCATPVSAPLPAASEPGEGGGIRASLETNSPNEPADSSRVGDLLRSGTRSVVDFLRPNQGDDLGLALDSLGAGLLAAAKWLRSDLNADLRSGNPARSGPAAASAGSRLSTARSLGSKSQLLGRVSLFAGGAFAFKEGYDQDRDASTGERIARGVIDGAFTTGGAYVVGGAAASGCGATVVLAWAAPGCAVAGGFVGGKVGGLIGRGVQFGSF